MTPRPEYPAASIALGRMSILGYYTFGQIYRSDSLPMCGRRLLVRMSDAIPDSEEKTVLRRLLPLALASAVTALSAAAIPASASTAPLRVTLPVPTGPHPVGTVSLHLVQNNRPDPWVVGRPRELMVSLWYPARHADRYPTAAYIPDAAWTSLEQNQGIPVGSVAVPQTAGHDGAPVDRAPGGLPVVLYSPGVDRRPVSRHDARAGPGQPRLCGGDDRPHLQ